MASKSKEKWRLVEYTGEGSAVLGHRFVSRGERNWVTDEALQTAQGVHGKDAFEVVESSDHNPKLPEPRTPEEDALRKGDPAQREDVVTVGDPDVDQTEEEEEADEPGAKRARKQASGRRPSTRRSADD